MIEPLCIERMPSRIQKESTCVAFALHPDPSSPSACWGSCTVTGNIDLVFHRAAGGMWHNLRIPGACEKKRKTPEFFRFTCAEAALLLGSRVRPADVVGYSFSESTTAGVRCVDDAAVVDSAARRGLPTVAMLICPSGTETNLLVLRPVLQMEGKKPVVCYRGTLLPAPDGVRHVVVSRGGDAALLLGQYASEHGGRIQCYSLCTSGDHHSHALFRSVQLAVPTTTAMTAVARGAQRVIWTSARKSLRPVAATPTGGMDMEVTLLTDHAVAMVFRVGVGDADGCCATCIWMTHCIAQQGWYKLPDEPIGVLERWKASPLFTQAVEGARSAVKPTSNDTTAFLHRFASATPIVRVSSNGAVLCVVVPNAHEVCIVGLGADPDACIAAHGVIRVMTPSHMTVHDALWVGGPLCGFLLLGVSDHGEPAATLYFLPLTGHPPLRVHVDQTHLACLVTDGGFFSFFLHGLMEDSLGTSQLRISLRFCRCNRGEKRGEEEGGGKLRTVLVSLPTIASVLPLRDPSHVFRMILFTGLSSFAALPDATTSTTTSTTTTTTITTTSGSTGGSNGASTGLQQIMPFLNVDGKDSLIVQLATEALLESRLDPWLHVGETVAAFPLRDVLHEVLHRLLEDTRRDRAVGEDHENSAVALLLAVFHGVAWTLSSLAVVRSPAVLLHSLSDIHSVLVTLRHALTLLGQSGAISACFTAAAFFANALTTAGMAVGGESCCNEWRALIAPLFDDAFTLTASFPSLSHALLPYCSTPVQCMMQAGEHMTQRERSKVHTTSVPLVTVDNKGEVIRPLEEVLSLARRGPSGLALLSVSDVCWAAQRLFLRDGVAAARSFLANIVDNHQRCSSEVCNLRVEYDAAEAELAAVLCCI